MLLKFFANAFWIHTPGFFQKKISEFFSYVFSLKISRLFILPYCVFFGLNTDYLDQFESETGEGAYQSYSDFFRRRFKSFPELQQGSVWPCEGYVCDWGSFQEKSKSLVKGQKLDLNSIFLSDSAVTKDYFFTNVFLHNHNYHRVHSPIQGRITKITEVPGDLIFLRPWFYKRQDVSYPAVRNERFIFEIQDEQDRPWYLAMVGGFGVGSIEVNPQVHVGTQVQLGQEIAQFKLGSTVCLATPERIHIQEFMQVVRFGQKLELV